MEPSQGEEEGGEGMRRWDEDEKEVTGRGIKRGRASLESSSPLPAEPEAPFTPLGMGQWSLDQGRVGCFASWPASASPSLLLASTRVNNDDTSVGLMQVLSALRLIRAKGG